MKTIKQCQSIGEAIDLIQNVLSKSKDDSIKLKLKDKILIHNLYHDLDIILNYEKSKGRVDEKL